VSSSTYLLHAFWPARMEDEVSCAARLRRLLERLPTGPVPAAWKEGYRPISLDVLASLFDRNRFFTDGRIKRCTPELGFCVVISSPMVLADKCFIDLHVGAYDDHNPHCNSIRFDIPKWPPDWGKRDASALRATVRAVVETWEAEEASVTSYAYQEHWRRSQGGNGADSLYIPWEGWITYLPAEKAARVTTPEGVGVEVLENGGVIYTLCEEPFSLDNPLHMQRAAAMQRALEPVQTSRP
jgi:hypothetical protein